MSVFSDIDQLLNPGFLTSFREDMPPVQCIIWKGAEEFKTITFDKVFPFDQLDDIKRMLCSHFKEKPYFHPKYVFVGVPLGTDSIDAPTMDTTYLPLDYLWFPPGSSKSSETYELRNPRKSLLRSDSRFSTPDGSFPAISPVPRGRATIEEIFLKPRAKREHPMPVLHVFTLHHLYQSYRGTKPISEEEWNKRLAPYFPNITAEGPFEPSVDDITFAKTIHRFIERREKSIERLNSLLGEGPPMPQINITGVRMLRLILQKPPTGFEGCESLFYRIKTTEHRPFLRLIPAEGTAVTKVLVKGALPIPALDDPHIILQWAKESSPTAGKNFMYAKYIHRKSIGKQGPIYGTIRVFDDGTSDILLQPPKHIRKLDPSIDFKSFDDILATAMADMPQALSSFRLGEAALLFSISIGRLSPQFTKARLRKRMPFFQTFFQEIAPLPEHTPLMSLRYKAVSQYASEDKLFSFLTQFTTQKIIEGEGALSDMVTALQDEFQLSTDDSRKTVDRWLEQKGTFSVVLPDENEFMESFNPGIDIHIYSQHPFYAFQANRIDSYDAFHRIYTLLGLLFIEDDDIFNVTDATAYATSMAEVESESLKDDEYSPTEDEGTASALPHHMLDLMEDDDEATVAAEAVATPTTAPTAPAAPKTKVAATAIAALGDEKLVNPKSWFINKLQGIDPRLFTEGVYSRVCAANEDRQPAVLTKAQFDRMIEEYEEDVERSEVFFRIYPLEDDDDQVAPPGVPIDEVYTVMRYGTDPLNLNYYLCPEFYCLADEIMVRKRDFEATRDRRGRSKLADTCPFCHGKLITKRNNAIRGHTVIQRKKKGGEKFHSHIGFAGKSKSHSEGFSFPCCHVSTKTLRIAELPFKHMIDKLADMAHKRELSDSDDETSIVPSSTAIEYGYIFQTMSSDYILGPEKYPLDAGKVAVVPAGFDEFFEQSTAKITQRVAIQQKLRPLSEGFIRVGTDNTSINDSLLGVLAPLLFKNTVQEVKERIIEAVNPRVFVAANFGNLVHEFYDPTQGRKPTMSQLSTWASSHLNLSVGANEMQIQRIYNAYHNFIRFIESPDRRKELRHLTPLLAEGIITTESRGINLVIIDWNSKNIDAPLSIHCPPYGVSAERHKKNDIVFISRDVGYEMFVYTKNVPAKGRNPDTHDYILRWSNATRDSWPPIVTHRVDEFYNKCTSRYRSLYTSESGINPMSLLGLSDAIRLFKKPRSLLRDAYNHATAILYAAPAGGGFIAIPVVDDGYMAVGLDIILDWTAYKAAAADEIVKFYTAVVGPTLRLYPGYKVIEINRAAKDGVVAVKLANNIHIPARDPISEEGIAGIEVKTIEELEWVIDRDILSGSCGSLETDMIIKTTHKQIDELYQHFRISVANWLATPAAGPTMRKDVERIIFSALLPDYEKRKRLQILLSSTLKTWFYLDPEEWEMPTSFMRKDCRIIDTPGACTGACTWVEEGAEPRCRIHVSETTNLGLSKDGITERDVNTALMYTNRLIDELIRFPNRRKQIMRRDVSMISGVAEPFRQGDQYIIPESSPTWLNILRMDWAEKDVERPKFYEEMTGVIPADNVVIEDELSSLPDSLIAILGGTRLRLWLPELEEGEGALMALSPAFGIVLSEIAVAPDATILSKDQVEKLSQTTRKTYGIINMRVEPIEIYFIGREKQETDPIVLIVFMPGETVGLLVEEAGNAHVSNLPDSIKELYKSRVRTKPVITTKRVLRIKRAVEDVPNTISIRSATGPSLAPIEATAEVTGEVVPEVTDEEVPEVIPEVVPEVPVEVVPEVIPEVVPEVPVEVVPEVIPEVVPEITDEVVPEVIPEVVPEVVPEITDEVVPEEEVIPEVIPEVHIQSPESYDSTSNSNSNSEESLQSIVKSIAKPIVKSIVKPVAKPIVKPVAKPIVKQSILKSAVLNTTNSNSNSNSEESLEPLISLKPSVKQPIIKSAVFNSNNSNSNRKLRIKSAVKSVAAPAVKSVVKSIAKPTSVAAPAIKPVAKSKSVATSVTEPPNADDYMKGLEEFM